MAEEDKVLENTLKNYARFTDTYANKCDSWLKQWNFSSGAPISTQPTLVMSEARESLNILEIVQKLDNPDKLMAKTISAMGTLCQEMSQLVREAQTKFYNPILFYGYHDMDNLDEADKVLMFSRILPTLNELLLFQDHCQSVILSVIQQMSILYGKNCPEQNLISVRDFHLNPVFDKLGHLLRCLVTLDDLVQLSGLLRDHWTNYKRMIRAGQADPERFGVSADKMDFLQKLLKPFDDIIFGVGIFRATIGQNFNKHGIAVTTNSALFDEMLYYLSHSLAEIENDITLDCDHGLKIVSFSASTVFFSTLFKLPDKNHLSKMWDLFKKFPCLCLYENVLWFPDLFIMSCLPTYAKSVDKKIITGIGFARMNWIQTTDSEISQKLASYEAEIITWTNRMETLMRRPTVLSNNNEELNRKIRLLLTGLGLGVEIKNLVRMYLLLNSKMEITCQNKTVLTIFHLVEQLKIIDYIFNRHRIQIADELPNLLKILTISIIRIIRNVKNSLVSKKSKEPCDNEIISCLQMAESVIFGAPTSERFLVAKIALSFALEHINFKSEELIQLKDLLAKLEVLSRIQSEVRRTCDLSFFYWHRSMVQIYFEHIFENPRRVHKLTFIFGALNDSLRPLSCSKHLENNQDLVKAFEKEIIFYFREKLIVPLGLALETELRLQFHSHYLNGEKRNPFVTKIKDLRPFFWISPLQLSDILIDVKAEVEHHLSETFYKMASGDDNKWKECEEMKCLAFQIFKLDIKSNLLPPPRTSQKTDENRHLFRFQSEIV